MANYIVLSLWDSVLKDYPIQIRYLTIARCPQSSCNSVDSRFYFSFFYIYLVKKVNIQAIDF